MPFFKSTYNILKKPDEDEVFNSKWMNSNKLVLPPGGPDDKKNCWDYSREMKIEDVDIWEVIYEGSGGIGVYASWLPYAEFYMITCGWYPLKPGQYANDRIIEIYYGQGAQQQVQNRVRDMRLPIGLQEHWVDPEDMWLYQNKRVEEKIFLSTTEIIR
jgi:hypothetical protein